MLIFRPLEWVSAAVCIMSFSNDVKGLNLRPLVKTGPYQVGHLSPRALLGLRRVGIWNEIRQIPAGHSVEVAWAGP